jgi:beta-lactamase superfamily II metal-dependent hydrolase
MIDISIDMLSVGNADSIIVWLKDNNSNHFVILIDGGKKSDGEAVIQHLETHLKRNVGYAAPDLIICTHHDQDHIGGLTAVVEKYKTSIGEIWINNPADHISHHSYQTLKESFRRKSAQQQYKVILESIKNVEDFISVVDRIGIERKPALHGRESQNGIIKILGPTKDFYDLLLPGMDGIENFVSAEANYVYNSHFSSQNINEAAETSSPCPIVDAENNTSATNSSSVILEIKANQGKRFLFTGDAGVKAFEDVEKRYSLANIFWLDVPHHGARRNLSSNLIDTMRPTYALISAKGGSDTKHPRKALVFCLRNHGAKVYSTSKSGSLNHKFGNFPKRGGYSTANEVFKS